MASGLGQFDPASVPSSALGCLTLLDVIGGGCDFRVRLVGSGTLAAVGSNATGKTLEGIAAGEILKAALMRPRAVLLYRRPVDDIVEYELGTGARIKTPLLTLPFSVDGVLIDQLLGIYSPVPGYRGPTILRNLVVPPNTHVRRSRAVL